MQRLENHIRWAVDVLFGQAIAGHRVVTVERLAGTKAYNQNMLPHVTADSVYNQAIAASDMGRDITYTPFLLDATDPSAKTRTAAEARATRAVWIDIDVRVGEDAKPNTFQDANVAWETIWQFITAYNYPAPSFAVATGGGRGFHLYWLFDRYITPDVYQTMGNRFNSILQFSSQSHAPFAQLHSDTTRIADPAGLMRIPGTWNSKAQDVSSIVYGMDNPVVYDFNVFDQATADIVTKYGVPYIINGKSKRESKHQPDNDITFKVPHFDMESTCGLIAFAKQNQEDIPEPVWRNTVGGLANYIKNGFDWAVTMSEQHSGFDVHELQSKIDGWNGSGPPTCETICNDMAQVCQSRATCDSCDYKSWLDKSGGKSMADSSPINVAQMYREGFKERDIQIAEIKEDISTEVHAPVGFAGVTTNVDVTTSKQTGLADAMSFFLNNADTLKQETKKNMELVGGVIQANDMAITSGMVWVREVFNLLDDSGPRAIAVLNAVHSRQLNNLSPSTGAKVKSLMLDVDTISDPKKLMSHLTRLHAAAAGTSAANALSTLMSMYVNKCYMENEDVMDAQPNVPYFDQDNRTYYMYGYIMRMKEGKVDVQKTALHDYLVTDQPLLESLIKSRLPNEQADPNLLKTVWDAYADVSPILRIFMYGPTASLWMPLSPELSCRGMWIHLQGVTGTGKTTLMQVALSTVTRGLSMESGASGSNAGRMNYIRATGNMPVGFDEVTGLGPQGVTEMAYSISDGFVGLKADNQGQLRKTGHYMPPVNKGAINIFTTGNISLAGVLQGSDLTATQQSALTRRMIDFELSTKDRPNLDEKFIDEELTDLISDKYGAMLLPVLMEMMQDPDVVTERIARWRKAIRDQVEATVPYTYSAYRILGAVMAANLAACELMNQLGMTDDNPVDLLPAAVDFIVDKFNVDHIALGMVSENGLQDTSHAQLMRRIRSFMTIADEKGAIYHADGMRNPRVENPQPPVGRFLFDTNGAVIGAVVSSDELTQHLSRGKNAITPTALKGELSAMAAGQFFVEAKNGSVTSMERLHEQGQTIECFVFDYTNKATVPDGNIVQINAVSNNTVSAVDTPTTVPYTPQSIT